MIAVLRNHTWKCIFGACFVLLLLALLIEPPIDRSQVHPPLLALKKPYRTIEAAYYLDGGSVGIHVVDRDGTGLEYALPVSTNKANPYPEVWFGSLHISKGASNLVRLDKPAETKKFLLRVVAQQKPLSGDALGVLIFVRGLPKDYARALVRQAVQAGRADVDQGGEKTSYGENR